MTDDNTTDDNVTEVDFSKAEAEEANVPSTPREVEMYMKGQADMAERIQLEQDAAGQAEPTLQVAVRPSDAEDPDDKGKYDVIVTANVGNGHVVQVKETCVLNGITLARDNARKRALSILETIRAED